MNLQSLIKSFQTLQELEDTIAELIITEMQQPGLILLPVGNTFENRIYNLVNKHFALEIDNLKTLHQKVNAKLRLSHLDELIDGDAQRFSKKLRFALANIIEQIADNFYAFDVDDIDAFDKFIKADGGPRVIFLGLGKDPENAHVAFIGEEYLNSDTAIVNLAPSTAEALKCKQGLTIGTDIFKSSNLEKIIVVASGKSKSEALESAFHDPDTGLGYLIAHHSSKLSIYADYEALSQI